MENDYSMAIDRLDRSVEKMGDKLDAIVTSMNDMKVHMIRIESKLEAQEQKTEKDHDDVWHKFEEEKIERDQKITALEDRLKKVEDQQTAFMTKYGVPLSAIFAIGTIIIVGWVSSYAQSKNPLNPTPPAAHSTVSPPVK